MDNWQGLLSLSGLHGHSLLAAPVELLSMKAMVACARFCCSRVEERLRQERLAANLKACRVGMASKVREWLASGQSWLLHACIC
jgi:hypothetical protein